MVVFLFKNMMRVSKGMRKIKAVSYTHLGDGRTLIEKTHLALLGVKIARPAFWVYDMQKITRGTVSFNSPF